MTRLVLLLAGLVGIVAGNAGCTSLESLKLGKDKVPASGDKNPVVQILPIWQPGEGPGIDGKTTRGFLGQIYFFTANSAVAAKVNGEVWFYLFDDQGTDEEQIKPLHQFQYKAEHWTLLGEQGKLGQVYSVFVPYTRAGYHKAQCGLRVKYIPERGLPIHSEMAYIGLPGRKTKSEAAATRGGLKGETVDSADFENEDDSDVVELDDAQVRPFGKSAHRKGAKDNVSATLAKRLESIDLSAMQHPKRRPVGSPLDDSERDRIVREMRARGEAFSVPGDEETEMPKLARTSRGRRVVQANFEEDADELDDADDDAAIDRSPPATRFVRGASTRRRTERAVQAAVLADASELEEEEADSDFGVE
ncbi:MAG: hypothetical protein NT069_35940 [Planctomycetota bacterium]|nr:hypothetical protein [Planctomycetota bacterium]